MYFAAQCKLEMIFVLDGILYCNYLLKLSASFTGYYDLPQKFHLYLIIIIIIIFNANNNSHIEQFLLVLLYYLLEIKCFETAQRVECTV